jgi:hypothetical protein
MNLHSRALAGLALLCVALPVWSAPLSIRNEALELQFDPATSILTVQAGQKTVLSAKQSGLGVTQKINHPIFGAGQALEIQQPDGRRTTASLFPRLPFALLQTRLRNSGTTRTLTRQVETFSARINLELPAEKLRTLGTGGLLTPEKNPGSYAWLAIADPATQRGVVAGWLTHDRASGILSTKVVEDRVELSARLDYGRLQLEPGQEENLETLLVGGFDDAQAGLEAWADAVARAYQIRLRPQPAGYCTWYSRPHGGAASEKPLLELAGFAATNLAPYGFSVVQIDDGWQDGISTNGPKRNFSTHRATGPYPGGMQATASNLKQLGLTAGIWFMPFAGTYYDPFFQPHPDWFVKTTNGTPFETAWGGTCLDMTHPGARTYLSNNIHRIAHEWGYQYFKMDGLWTGTGTRQQYVNSGFKEDGIGDALFANPTKSNIEAYRDGLKLVRAAAGPEIFFLGCCTPQNMRSYAGAFGLVDAMRIGPDNGSDWKSLMRGPVFGSRHYFLHGRIWYNDPDPVYVRANMPLKHAQLICSWVGISGQLNLSSEWLPGLSPERLDLLRRSLPGHGLRPRPVDFFENDPPRIWRLTDDRSGVKREVVALYNWGDTNLLFDLPLTKLGLTNQGDCLAFDYWGDELLPACRERLQVAVPPQSCRILTLRAQSPTPSLLSTSRHVTQGIVDVAEERWEAANRTLHGRSRLVGGDPYELRVTRPANLAGTPPTVILAPADTAAGVTATVRATDSLLRVQIASPASREVAWQIRFP